MHEDIREYTYYDKENDKLYTVATNSLSYENGVLKAKYIAYVSVKDDSGITSSTSRTDRLDSLIKFSSFDCYVFNKVYLHLDGDKQKELLTDLMGSDKLVKCEELVSS